MVAAQPLQGPHSATFGKPRACFRSREWKLSLDRDSPARACVRPKREVTPSPDGEGATKISGTSQT